MKMLKQLGSYALALLLAIIAIIGAVIIALNNLNSSLQSTSTNLSSEVALVSANLTSDPIISTNLCNYKTTISSDLTYTDGFVSGATVTYSGSGNCIDSKLAAAFSDPIKGTAVVVFPTTLEGYDCKNDFSGYHTITAIVDVVDYGNFYNDGNPITSLTYDVNNYFPLYNPVPVENSDASSFLTPTSTESLLELFTGQQSLQLLNGGLLLATGGTYYPEYFNQATCFISWKDVDDATINGITDDHKQTVLTNIESEVATLNEELNTMTSSINTVDEYGDSGGGAYPYGNDLLTYDYSAITSAITNIDALFAVVDGKASSDYYLYKVDYATQANNYGNDLKVSYGDSFVYNPNTAAEQLSADIDTTLEFLDNANNDLSENCQISIDATLSAGKTFDTVVVLSDVGSACPENVLALAIGQISAIDNPVNTLDQSCDSNPLTNNGHYINVSIEPNGETVFNSTITYDFFNTELLDDGFGEYFYNNNGNQEIEPPNGEVSLSINASTNDGIAYTFTFEPYISIETSNGISSACFYWSNTNN